MNTSIELSIIREIREELRNATEKHPLWPTDPLHAVAIVSEECGELVKAVLEYTYEPQKTTPEQIVNEATQAAVTLIRFLAGVRSYSYKKADMVPLDTSATTG